MQRSHLLENLYMNYLNFGRDAQVVDIFSNSRERIVIVLSSTVDYHWFSQLSINSLFIVEYDQSEKENRAYFSS